MTTQFLKLPSGSIAYDNEGSGPLVICAPSMGDVRAEYRFLAPALVAAGYRVATMDLRGLGESSTAWDDFSVAGVGSDLVCQFADVTAPPLCAQATPQKAESGRRAMALICGQAAPRDVSHGTLRSIAVAPCA